MAVIPCWCKKNMLFFHSSSACPRLRKSVMRRKRGQSPSKRFYGEPPPVCLCTPAQEPEVHLCLCLNVNVRVCWSCPITRSCCVDMMQQSVTVTAVKLSSQTGVIIALRVTCKETIFIEYCETSS